jgi:signal transduction histidine kinase
MDTASMLNKSPRFLLFTRKLFLAIVSLFLVFAVCFGVYQYRREKAYKSELLDARLQACNDNVHDLLSIQPDSLWGVGIEREIAGYNLSGLRVTLMSRQGQVIYDTADTLLESLDNHVSRPEVKMALAKGKGYNLRQSSTTGVTYFYSATAYQDVVIRSAAPYTLSLIHYLSADKGFLLFIIVASLILVFVLYKMTNYIGGVILTLEREEQGRQRRKLTQNIAHELKTPVSSIQGYLETILANPDISPEKQLSFLERCLAQSTRLSRLLRDISALTRMDEAPEMTEITEVNISRMVGDIVKEVSLELEERHITVIDTLRPNILIRGDQSLLYSIFRNLLDNAIAYAGANVRVHIRCTHEDDTYCYFCFSDTGVGVEPKHLDRLFERFYRVDKGRSRKLGGTGLGLAIVKNAVHLHGGTITVANREEGGLEFLFSLRK